jgi:hypothetical protein
VDLLQNGHDIDMGIIKNNQVVFFEGIQGSSAIRRDQAPP